MARHTSKIICPKCRKRGGTLALRLTGHSKKSLSLYIQHSNREKKAGKGPCYITRHGIAHIRLADRRYESEYKPLIKYYRIAGRDHLVTDDQLDRLSSQAARVLIDMGWPSHSLAALDKVFADRDEILVEELALQYKQTGVKMDHDTIAKKHFKEELKKSLGFTEIERNNRKRKRRHKKR